MCFTDRLRARQAVQIAATGFERRNVGQTGWTVGAAAVCNPAKFYAHRCYTRCGGSPSTYMPHMLRFSGEQQCVPRQCTRVAETKHFRFRWNGTREVTHSYLNRFVHAELTFDQREKIVQFFFFQKILSLTFSLFSLVAMKA